MRLSGFAVGRANGRDANALLTEVHQHPAMEDLVVWVREDDQQRRTA
jgi:hypothetical protein